MNPLVAFIFCLATGARIEVAELVRELARADIVFVGEEHDNRVGHEAELIVLRELHKARGDVVLSLEMLERDVQGTVNDWLKGRIDDAALAAHARLWPNHAKDYAPLLRYAKDNGLDVIAANVPRPLAKVCAEKGVAAVAGLAHTPRRTSAEADLYAQRFEATMKEHMGAAGADMLQRFYQAQCLKDDAMAESIADFLATHPARKPLVVHYAGRFHVEEGLGTVARTLARLPLARTAVLLLPSHATPDKATAAEYQGKAHFVWVCPEQKKDAPVEAVAEEKKAGLGIMPDYADSEEPGVLIGSCVPDGAAEKGGLKAGDRILAINGERIEGVRGYMEVLAKHKPGERVTLRIEREIRELDIELTLGVSNR
jgi:uncharacterized iron-regulated protein